MGNSNSTQKKLLITGAVGFVVAAVVGSVTYDQIKKRKGAPSLEASESQPQQPTQSETKPQQEQPQQPKSDLPDFDLAFINRINKELKDFEQNQTPLSIETIVRIFSSGFKGAEQQYAELQKQNRLDRRAAINNPQQYVQTVMRFNESLEQILTQRQLDVCAKLRIQADVFESSFFSHMQDQMAQQQIMMVQLQLRQQLIGSIQSLKEVKEADFQQAITVQISKLDDVNYFKQYIQYLQQEEYDLAGILVSVLLSDQIYQELGFEEEDIMEGLKKNPQQMMSFAQIQGKVMELMQKLMM